MIVPVAVADSTTVEHQAVIEQRALTVLNRLELSKEIGELLHMVSIDAGDLLDLLLIALVMGQAVVCVWYPDLPVRAIASFAAQHKRADASEVGLERDRH